MKFINRHTLTVAAASVLLSACADTQDDGAAPEFGTLNAALAFAGSTHDVATMAYRVVAADADCDDEAIDEAISALEEEALPAWLADGANHAFSDALFVLQPGDYKVCVTPLDAEGNPSAICAPAEGVFTVTPEQTTEGVLYSQCLGDPSGGLDVIAALNNPPHIDDLDIAESKFIDTCEDATITVTASDPDGDPLSYTFEITDAPDGSTPNLVWDGNVATFNSDVAGPYGLTVTVDDGIGGQAQLSFPVHVSECDFSAPDVGQAGDAGVLAGDGWLVCRADDETAWMSANNTGTYNAVEACESLGYVGVDAWGGNCGTVCGHCGTDNEIYDGNGGATPESIQFTVTWRCVR